MLGYGRLTLAGRAARLSGATGIAVHDSRKARWCGVRRPRLLAGTLRKFEYQPCIPNCGTKVPAGPDRLHEIKHDCYRLIVQREGKRVRLLTRRGCDWSDR